MTDEPGLYLSDKEIAGRLGIGIDRWRANAVVLEKGGLPKRDPLFAGRRYWPAVRAFLDRRHGLEAASKPAARSWEENFHAKG